MPKHHYEPAPDVYVPPAELFEGPVFDTTYVEQDVYPDWVEPSYGNYEPLYDANYVMPRTNEEKVWSSAYLEPGFR